LPNNGDDLLVTVDTGFNGQLLIHDTELVRLGYYATWPALEIELAGRERRAVGIVTARIIWFGQERDVNVFVAGGTRRRAAVTDDPVGLLGTVLLTPHRLMIDFATRRVVISENSDQS
jgi:predicted aspartyl protease